MAAANILQQTFLSFTTDTMYSFSSEHRKEGPHLQLLISIWLTRYSILHKADGQYEIVFLSASDPKPRDSATQWTCWLVDNQHRDPPLMSLYQRLFFSLLTGSPIISHNLGGGSETGPHTQRAKRDWWHKDRSLHIPGDCFGNLQDKCGAVYCPSNPKHSGACFYWV